MEQNKTTGINKSGAMKKQGPFYLWMNIFLLILLPLFTIAIEVIFEHEVLNLELVAKWFIFWAIGIRLFTAGVSQASNPVRTAAIFRMKTEESFVIIRELGFANISIGVVGILSVINEHWRLLAAITGGLFLGMAGIQHLFKKRDTRQEDIAMLYDLGVLLFILFYLAFSIII